MKDLTNYCTFLPKPPIDIRHLGFLPIFVIRCHCETGNIISVWNKESLLTGLITVICIIILLLQL